MDSKAEQSSSNGAATEVKVPFWKRPAVATTVDTLGALAQFFLCWALSIALYLSKHNEPFDPSFLLPTLLWTTWVATGLAVLFSVICLIGVLAARDRSRLLPTTVAWVGCISLALGTIYESHPFGAVAGSIFGAVLGGLILLRCWRHCTAWLKKRRGSAGGLGADNA